MEGINHCVDREPRLPPGFRFYPTDEELITYYLARKIARTVEYGSFWDGAITEVDLNKYEPWELPGMAQMGEKEWYFYSLKDRKYPSGLRTNRATQSGYWKATGKDKEVNNSARPKQLVGMKKTLVFYKGRAPKGLKTSWVMHEYRMEGEPGVATASGALTKLKGTKKEWVVCRVFHKSLRGKRLSLAELQRAGAAARFNDFCSVTLPRFTDSFTATGSIPAQPPRYLANTTGAASMTDIRPSNFADAPDAKLAALADYLSFYTTPSSDCTFPLSSSGSVYVSSLQHSSSTTPRQPFLQSHGAPSLTYTQSATPAQLYSQQVVQHEQVRLNDIAAAGGCLSADGLSDSCTTDAPSGSNVVDWLLPRYPSDLESLWFNSSA